MRKWFYVLNDQKQGPIEETDLVYMFTSSQLPPETMLWTEGMQEWVEATHIKNMISQASPPPISQSKGAPTSFSSRSTTTAAKATFLYIPVSRFIVLSILSCGLYEVYWIYKNWGYLKERDGLSIKPFWRGIFGVFYCGGLLKTIHQDQELMQVERPSFSPIGLTTGWILLVLFANSVSRAPGATASIVAYLTPSFLFLLPVQNYINSVNLKRNPNTPHAKWSAGHIVCLIFGLLFWVSAIMTIGKEY